ncbi:pre-mrna splicing factor cwc24 [Lasallia pustulata]|uniref:Pre-mRNA-splicing factor CWC24 n=1 Tax=Lasallia pustulata TaxID=136370 RepID=A0A1W5D9X5_9LECA|nr:pre-mrna splicing factor cwc24 [Lasallia pustulata]
MQSTDLAGDVPEVVQPLFKKRGAKKANLRKRPATPPSASDASDYSSSGDEQGQRIKRRRKTAGVTASSGTAVKSTAEDLEVTKFAADRSALIESTNDATKQSNWFDENGKDEMSAKSLLGSTRPRPDAGTESERDGTYKGASNYQSFIQKNPNAPSRQFGPVKAATNIRTVTVTDFAPDVCKDYKQTGFCGFGDSCKFLHAREDYKQGWQLDKDWENVTKGKMISGKTVASANRDKAGNVDGASDDDGDAVLEGIPFACIICKRPYTNPVVTKCGHYFCEACALKRYRKYPSCAACGAGTAGVFNGAKNLKKLLDKKRERAKKRREKALENGEEVSDDEGMAFEDE